MPLFSEHISNMYYGASPSYSSPSYGYKSSYVPLGSSYSASYLSPGGSYSTHSSLSSYSRAPLSTRWIPGISRSYSPMLTPISERGAASPIRINSPRRIPIAKRCYGTPSYIQRPININTESIDVSRDRYRPKPPEPSATTSPSVPKPQIDNMVKDKENGPFMPRVDGKPETGIDSSPGIQRNTIKRGRTVVRLHTIKRKDKDSPRKPAETSRTDEINKQQTTSESIIDDAVLVEPKEPLRWREKLSDDLVYVDKKEKKSLGTKLVEKFILKEVNEKDNSEIKSGEETSKNESEMLLPSSEAPSTSKSPDRRCSMELLAEQASLLDSLIRGENLSTATLDLSKIGIDDQPRNKLVSSDSIKRRKTDDKGNPLKTTKSDHSLHESLNKSLKGNKDSKVFAKKRSLKKSQSGGSICRLDSITEFPKESIQVDLPAIQENRFSPKEQKIEQKPKLRTKITASVEISPPTSPLKFRIENVTVEEKIHKPKKEISFSYDIDETPVADVTVQGPTSTLRRTKERNSVKKKSKTVMTTDPISPEPDDGNFWAKIGKRETVYLIKRKQNIEAAREENKRSHFWFQEDEEPGDDCNKSVTKDSNDSSKLPAISDIPVEHKPKNMLPVVKDVNSNNEQLKNVLTKLEKSKSSDNLQKLSSEMHNSSLKEKKVQAVVEPKQDSESNNNKKTDTNINQQDAERKETIADLKQPSEENVETEKPTKLFSGNINPGLVIKSINTSGIQTNLETSKTASPKMYKTFSPTKKTSADATSNTSDLIKELKPQSVGEAKESSKPIIINNLKSSTETAVQEEKAPLNTVVISNTQTVDVKEKHIEKELKSKIDKDDINLSPEIPELPKAKNEGESTKKDLKLVIEKVDTNKTIPVNSDTTETSAKNITKEVATTLHDTTKQTEAKAVEKSLMKDSKPMLDKIKVHKATIDVGLIGTHVESKTKPIKVEITPQVVATSGEQDPEDNFKATDKRELIECSKNKDNSELSADAKKNSEITTAPLQVLTKNESTNLETDPVFLLEKNKMTANVKNICDIVTAKRKEQVSSVLTLQVQAKRKIEDNKSEVLTKCKQVESVVDSNVNKQVTKSTTNSDSIEATAPNSKKKVKKVRVKSSEKSKDLKTEKSAPKDKICETCLKTLPSDDKKITKLNVTRVINSSTSKPLQEKDGVKITGTVDKPINSLQKSKSDLDKLANSSVSNLKPQTSASTSQIPVVLETNNIPNKTVASDIKPVENSLPSQEKTGEENKAENDAGDQTTKVKKSSVKKVAKKPVKQDAPPKPLIATPRPLLKRAPQVIHSDSSDSSSEEDSSEEEESDTSENSGDFYECENNPDGRTSTGSNDSGFDSSAPTSPASFLQIKKDCDVNCHRKCEKLTANLCGVNQRLLVEALATRTASKKGGGDSPGAGPSSSNASSQLPDTDVGDSELELEQSTAYGLFRKTGRFTPPARSIPRFRKYNIEDFQFIKVLGKGSFGKVLLAELRDTEYYYAVKCLKKDVVLEDDDVECTLIERKVLALGTNHPYLCHLFATFQTDSHLFFVMEYLNGGDLMFHIQQSGRFPEPRARFYAAEIVSGLKFLHKRGIVYRDLKLDNILLDFDGHVRIADFGMCKLQIYLDKTADTFCGTPDYMAPEIIKGLKYNQTVDWWSFGVLLYEMLIGQSPFSGCDEDELFWSICNEMPSYPRFLSREALTILTRLLDKDARTRLGGTECMHGDVREQDFFHPVHWDKLERRELETPFKPRVRHPLDTQYFDRAFTGERPRLTAVEPHVLRSMDQEPFRGFSYTNPNATDR